MHIFVAILAVFFLDSFSWAVPIAIGNKRWDEADTKLAVFEAPAAASSPGEVCDQGNSVISISSLEFDPSSPVKGESLKITVHYNSKEEVTGGNIKIKLKYGIVTVYNQNEDFCDALEKSGSKCPLPKGQGTLSTTQTIPSNAPHGHYKGNMKATDQDEKELLCINFDFHL